MTSRKGQALIEFLVCGSISLALLYLTFVLSFKVLYSTLITGWIDEHFLCRYSARASAQITELTNAVCTTQLNAKLRQLHPQKLRIDIQGNNLQLEFQHAFFNYSTRSFSTRCPLKSC